MSDSNAQAPITLEEFQRLVFDLRDRLWEDKPPMTPPGAPLRLTGWRGRAHDLLDQVLDFEDDDA